MYFNDISHPQSIIIHCSDEKLFSLSSLTNDDDDKKLERCVCVCISLSTF